MNILVTGGLGFIGHNVVAQLEQLGHNVVIVDHCTNYGIIPEDELTYLLAERQKKIKTRELHYNDIGQTGMFSWLLPTHQIDAIVHLASFPRQQVVNSDPVLASRVMSTGLIGLLELAKKHNVPKFVYISSSMVYGNFENNVTEDAVCTPQGQYGIMKYMGEKLVEDYSRRGFFEHVIIRPSAVYGELDVEDRVVSKFILSALRNGIVKVKGSKEVLDFTHVSDTAAGIVLATVDDAANNKIFNITRSNEESRNLLDAANLAVSLAGHGTVVCEERDLNFPKRGRLCINRARDLLGYNPTINIEQGFANYMQWFKDSTFWQAKL